MCERGMVWATRRDRREDKERKKWKKEKRREDWGVVALYRPINQHHSKGLGLSSYACAHTHTHVCVPYY